VPLTHTINHLDRWTNRFINPAARQQKTSRAGRNVRAEEALQSQTAAVAERRP
jgi:polar amino acid transport system permease protein